MTPLEGFFVPGFYSDAKEAERRAVNNWIRSSGACDGVIDFDALVRDPDHPSRLSAASIPEIMAIRTMPGINNESTDMDRISDAGTSTSRP
jgi:hypothetical protein